MPVLRLWVSEARKNGLKVWFRGNFSGWEGWFGYPQFTSVTEHHTKTKNFITKHPELFEAGDIFTPAPEPENGVIGDPRFYPGNKDTFNQFLVDSYINCSQAFADIRKPITCGYFSTNADVAREVLTRKVVKQIGNVVVIDHYTKTPETFGRDIEYLYRQFEAPIVLGEFGAPIPDLQGDLTEEEQKRIVTSLLNQLYQHRHIVKGVNYWTFAGSSTSLYNNDGIPRQVVEELKNYFQPFILTGRTLSPLGDKLGSMTVLCSSCNTVTVTDANGNYTLQFPAGRQTLVIGNEQYHYLSTTIEASRGGSIVQDFVLSPTHLDGWYRLREKIFQVRQKIIQFF